MPLSPQRAKEVERMIRQNAPPEEFAAELEIMERDVRAALGADYPLQLEPAVLHNFLIARQLKLKETLAMMEAHAAWFRATLPVQVTDALIAELKKGKVEVIGRDRDGRPLVLVNSRRFDPRVRDLKTSIDAILYLVEKVLATHSAAQKFTIYYDRTDFSFRQNWDFEYLRSIVSLLSNNYPERLHVRGRGQTRPASLALPCCAHHG